MGMAGWIVLGVVVLVILWMIATTMAFVAATFLLFRSTDPLTFLVFPALVMAFVYVLLGSLGPARFQWIGAGMFAVLIFGLLVGREAIAFWVAAAFAVVAIVLTLTVLRRQDLAAPAPAHGAAM